MQSTTGYNFEEAESKCEASGDGAHLAYINNEEEFQLLNDYVIRYANEKDSNVDDATQGTGPLGNVWTGMTRTSVSTIKSHCFSF